MAESKIAYAGYLSTFLYATDARNRSEAKHIHFSAEDIEGWKTADFDHDLEWKKVPAFVRKAEDAVSLSGRFDDEMRIDVLGSDDPSFWAPLGITQADDSRLPIDLTQYPILEITYRCLTDSAHPAFVWSYPGGESLTFLEPTATWRTAVYLLQHVNFPTKLESIVFRLYTAKRSMQTAEIRSVRFRAATPEESESIAKAANRATEQYEPPLYSVLNDFIPVGTFISAPTSQRMAKALGISMFDYWSLALQDLVRTRHNCAVIEQFTQLKADEWKELVSRAEHYDIKLLPLDDPPGMDDPGGAAEIVSRWIEPLKDSKAIFAWGLMIEPVEQDFDRLMKRKKIIETADPNHPAFCITRHATGFPLFARFFASAGLNQYASHHPWEIGDLVRNHVGLGTTQQFWMAGPAFTWGTDTPDWATCPEMRIMVNSSFANGARGWFSYTYHNDPIWLTGSCSRSLTGPFLAFSDLWQELKQTLGTLQPLLPLFHKTWPWHLPRHWYAWSERSGDHYEFPDGIPPTSSYRLRGPDYNLYFIISNDIRGMTSVTMDIPKKVMKGLEIYDATDFVSEHKWEPMRLERHLQMVPGQARVLMVAEKDVCSHWRQEIASGLIEDYRHRAMIEVRLAEAYQIDPGAIEQYLDRDLTGQDMEKFLLEVRDAYSALQDRIHAHHALSTVRSHIIESMSVACASDGALCRLVRRGRLEEAHDLGEKLLPIAKEFTNLRLELRAGNAGRVIGHADEVRSRALAVLNEIRSAV